MSNGKFASTGVVAGQTPQTGLDRRYQNLKGSRVTMGRGTPKSTDGAVGDITIRTLAGLGFRAYVKTNSGWMDINSMTAQDKIVWIDMNLASSWATHSTTYTKPQYCKDSNGFVHFRGAIKGEVGTSTTDNITTLPPGFRPSKPTICAVPNNGTWDGGQGSIQITAAGVVNMPNGGDTDKQHIDGVSFFAWQDTTATGGGGGHFNPDPSSGGDSPG